MPIYDLEQFRRSIADRRQIKFKSGGKPKMDEFTSSDEFVAEEPAPKKRKYSRRSSKPGQNGFSAPANLTAKRGGAIALDEVQFRKLFKLLTGGDLGVSVTEEEIRFHVPQAAIQMVLPALLEKL